MFSNIPKQRQNAAADKPPTAGTYVQGSCIQLRKFADIAGIDCYRRLIDKLSGLTGGVQGQDFKDCYEDFIANFFDYCQALPLANQNNLAGLFNQGLLRGYSMLLAMDEYYRQPEHQADASQALSKYVAFTAGCMLDIHQVITHKKIVYCDAKDAHQVHGCWDPLLGSLRALGNSYAYKIYAVESGMAHRYAAFNVLLGKACMPQRGMHWISIDQRLLAEWIKILSGESDLWGPFAYALQHYQRFMEGAELFADWVEYQELPEFALVEEFLLWLQKLREEEHADALHDTEYGVAMDLDTLIAGFMSAPEGQRYAETHGGSMSGVLMQFIEAFPMGIHLARISSRMSSLQSTGASAGKNLYALQGWLPASQKHNSLASDSLKVAGNQSAHSRGISLPPAAKVESRQAVSHRNTQPSSQGRH